MKVETVLPLGKLDPGLCETVEPLDLDGYFEGAKRVERIEIASAVAIAFSRSPTVIAQAAWTLKKLSHGRLSRGLGTQVKGHVERLYGMKWVPPGPWLRAYTQAVRAVWHADHTGAQPAYEGEHYSTSLMVPLFDPGPLEKPDIPIAIAGVKTYMSRVAGEVGNGLGPHPICTPQYIDAVMQPAIADGVVRSDRDPDELEITVAPLSQRHPLRNCCKSMSATCAHASRSTRLRRHTGLPSTITAIPTLRLNSRNCRKRSAGTRCQSRQRRGR